MMRGAFVLVSVAAAVGAGASCSAEFLPASVVVNQRTIAVTAEPPEAVPGQSVTLTPIVVDQNGDLVAGADYEATWWRCPDSDSDALGDYDQCSDPSTRVNIAHEVPYVDVVPSDIFGELPAPGGTAEIASDKVLGAVLGYWRVVGFNMAAGDRRVDAFKRIPVYLPVRLGDVDPRLAALDSHVDENGAVLPPNKNPGLDAVLIHEGKVNGPTKSELTVGKSYFFVPQYNDDLLEPYISLKVDLEGLDLSDPSSLKDVPVDDMIKRFDKVQRCEIPTFTWFVTAGRVKRDTTLDEGIVARHFDALGVDCPPVEGDLRTPDVEYTPPTGEEDDAIPSDGVVHAWVVMRDGRGGTAVRDFAFTVAK